MRWLVLLVPLVAVAQEPRGVVVLSGGRGGEPVLVEALRIYTRDLGRTVRLGGRAPASLNPEELAQVARAAGNAEVAVWFGDRVLYALRIATLEVRETAVEGDDPHDAARALALKVRALLTARNEAWTLPPPPSPSPSPSPSPTPAPIAPTPPTPTPPLPPPPPISIAARRVWVEATVAYGAIVPTNPDWVRHGLTLRVAVPVWRLALFADAAFTTAPTVIVDKNAVTARVWPVGVGVLFRLDRPQWRISGGPRLSLLIVDAEARSPNGVVGVLQRYSAGLGLLSEVVWKLSRHVAALASIGAEIMLPRQEFAAGGPSSTDLGWVQFSFSGGLLISIP